VLHDYRPIQYEWVMSHVLHDYRPIQYEWVMSHVLHDYRPIQGVANDMYAAFNVLPLMCCL